MFRRLCAGHSRRLLKTQSLLDWSGLFSLSALTGIDGIPASAADALREGRRYVFMPGGHCGFSDRGPLCAGNVSAGRRRLNAPKGIVGF